MKPEKQKLALRILVQNPVAGVAILLQQGNAEKTALVPPVGSAEEALTFDFDVFVEGQLADGRPRFLGPCVQGPPTARFVYLCVGQYAGQADSAFARRVKVPLGDLTWEQVSAQPPDGRLTARIEGTGKDGTPVCASVKILPPDWV